jgi:hypothetical protein
MMLLMVHKNKKNGKPYFFGFYSIFVFNVAFLTVFFASVSMCAETGLNKFPEKAFISPDVCGRCHSDIKGMWDGSMHSMAMRDSLFVAASKLFTSQIKDGFEKDDAERCISCHNPVDFRSELVKGSSDDYTKTTDVGKNAVSCDLCHTVSEIVKTQNASFNVSPGKGEDDPGIKRGPRNDAEPMYHEAVFSKIHTESQFCGTCHNVVHTGYSTKLENTYSEWLESTYNSSDPAKVVTCQDCHMRQAPGKPSTGMTERPDYPGNSAMMGKERPNIYRHYVVGANTFMPAILGFPEKASLAVERLSNAAVLEIIPGKDNSSSLLKSFTVRVKNEGAGHFLPTGVTEFRQMWLEVEIKDSSGKTVFISGGVGPEGALLTDTRIFNTVFGDSEGKPTLNVSKAAKILTDHRIPPKGFLDETFSIKNGLKPPLSVNAALKYRSMEPSVVKLLLGGDRIIPVVTMASVSEEIK